RWWQRNPSQAGWWATLLIAPHLALGTWLFIVPDHLAFTASQLVTLAHVALALVSLPIATIWIVIHLRNMRTTRPAGLGGKTVRWLLTAAAVVAVVTGVVALWGGDIVTPAVVHAWCGIGVGVPLVLH